VFCALWRDASDSFSDLSPAGAGSSCGSGCFLTQPICRASELIRELQRGQPRLESVGHARHGLVSAAFDELLD
jgi:hypothetical protein